MDSIIMDTFSFSDWYEAGKMTGMFNFDAPGLRDTDLTYSEAIQYLGILEELAQAGILTNENAIDALQKADNSRYFLSLVDNGDEYVEVQAVGTTPRPGYRYTVESSNHSFHDLVVFLADGKYSVSENRDGELIVKTFNTREQTGAYILKWILMKKG